MLGEGETSVAVRKRCHGFRLFLLFLQTLKWQLKAYSPQLVLNPTMMSAAERKLL